MHEAGVEVIFHGFYYSGHNKPNDELLKYCKETHYYRRNKNLFRLLFSFRPYIVSSRNHKSLLENLLKDDSPILFDGIHTCFYLDHPALKDRKKFVRTHNIEHDYYIQLANIERLWFKKEYLLKEAQRLHSYEPILKNATALFTIAKTDVEHFSHYAKTIHIPPFFITDHVRKDVNKSGFEGRFILYHGSLSVRENEKAAKFIINEVAPLVKHRIVIAGKSPSSWLKNEASIQENVKLVASPSEIQMDSLIQHAHIHLLVTFQQTGVKLKLLHALDNGKHVIINSKMDDGGLFSDMCHIKDDPAEIAKKIEELMKTDFTDTLQKERKSQFDSLFNNDRNALRLVEEIFSAE